MTLVAPKQAAATTRGSQLEKLGAMLREGPSDGEVEVDGSLLIEGCNEGAEEIEGSLLTEGLVVGSAFAAVERAATHKVWYVRVFMFARPHLYLFPPLSTAARSISIVCSVRFLNYLSAMPCGLKGLLTMLFLSAIDAIQYFVLPVQCFIISLHFRMNIITRC